MPLSALFPYLAPFALFAIPAIGLVAASIIGDIVNLIDRG